MTQDQVMGMLRQAIPFIGGIAVGKGWLTTAQVADLSTLIFQIAGPIMLICGSLWAYKANSKSSIIQSASAMPEVQGITLNDAALATAAKVADPTTNVQVHP